MTQQATDLFEIYDFGESFFSVAELDADENCYRMYTIDRPADGSLTEFLAALSKTGTAGWDNPDPDPDLCYQGLKALAGRGDSNEPRVIATAWHEDAENEAGYRVFERDLSQFGRAWAGLPDRD